MSEEKKKMIDETVENLKHLDEQSLLIVKSNSEVLKARDALDKKKTDEPD